MHVWFDAVVRLFGGMFFCNLSPHCVKREQVLEANEKVDLAQALTVGR